MKIRHSNISGIIKATSELITVPEHIVEDVISYQFKVLSDFFDFPTNPAIRLDHIGSFYISKNALFNAFSIISKRYRKTPSQKDLVKLKFLISVRHLSYIYSNLKNYKKRFGSWH